MAAPAFLKQAAAALAAAARQAPAGSLLASPARQSLLQALRGVAICRPYAANAAGEAAGSVEATERAIQEYNHERAGVAGERLVPKWFNAKSAKPKTSTDAANKGVRQNLYMSMVLVGVTLMLFVRDFLNPEVISTNVDVFGAMCALAAALADTTASPAGSLCHY